MKSSSFGLLTALTLVASGASVIGQSTADTVPAHVAAAKVAARRRKLYNASFAVALADVLPFQANSFDAAVSRFGVMFFASPVRAVREMLRVLKPGGRMALAAWHFAERNPFHYTVARVVERQVSSPPPAADSPDAFRFADPGKLRAVLSEAGAAAASERLLQFSIRASISVEEFWTLRSEMSENLRSKLAKMPTEQIAEVKREAMEALRPYDWREGFL